MLRFLADAEFYLRQNRRAVMLMMAFVVTCSGIIVLLSVFSISIGLNPRIPLIVLPGSVVILGNTLFLGVMWFVLWAVFAPNALVSRICERNAIKGRILQFIIGLMLIISVSTAFAGVVIAIIISLIRA